MVPPPSARIVWPVIYPEASLAKKTRMGVKSAYAVPILPIAGTLKPSVSGLRCASGNESMMACIFGVIAVGLMQLMLIPSFPHSRAVTFVSPRIASFTEA